MAKSSRCSICSRHRWAVDNTFLAHGSSAALDVCDELGISKSAFYRHRSAHLPLTTSTPPADNEPIEWARATINIAAAVEQYHIINDPLKVSDIGVNVGSDDDGQFIALTITHSEGALDSNAVDSIAFELGMDMEKVELTDGIPPIRRTVAKLHSPDIFVGRRNSR